MPLGLETIGEVIPGASYDKKRFAAMTILMHNPTCTILLFSREKMVVTGGKCWYESMCAFLFLKRMLQEGLVGTDFLVHECTIENIVAHVEVNLQEDQQLDLDSMYTKLSIQKRTEAPGPVH